MQEVEIEVIDSGYISLGQRSKMLQHCWRSSQHFNLKSDKGIRFVIIEINEKHAHNLVRDGFGALDPQNIGSIFCCSRLV